MGSLNQTEGQNTLIMFRRKVLTVLLDRFLPSANSLSPFAWSHAPVMDYALKEITNKMPHEQPMQAADSQEVMKSLSKLEHKNKLEATEQISPKTFKFKLGEVKVKIYNHKFQFKLAELKV